MKNNILQIVFNSIHSNYILDVEKYVRQFGTHIDANRIDSIVIEQNDDTWCAYSPVRDAKKWIKRATVLTLEYLLNLPIGFIFSSNGKEINYIIKEHYDERININGEDRTDNNLHLLIHLSLNDLNNVKALQFLINSIPNRLRDHIKIHLLLYSGSTFLGNAYPPIDSTKSRQLLREIVQVLHEDSNNSIRGKIFYLSNYDEQGYCLNLSQKDVLSSYVGRILLYLINDYKALSLNLTNSSNLTSIGLIFKEINKTTIINNRLQNILGKILLTFIGKTNPNDNRIREIFEGFISSNQKIVRKEFESDNISESNIHDGILDSVKKIIDSKDLSLQEKDEIIKKLNRLWNQDQNSVEDSLSENTFEDIYMPLIDELGFETPYPQVKDLLNEIKEHKTKINKQEKKLDELKKNLPPLEQNCFWTSEGFRVGDNVYRVNTQDPLIDNHSLDIIPYKPTENEFGKSRDIRNGFSEIRNQGNQGSCVSFSLVSIIEYYINSGLEKNDLSESFLYYTARAINDDTDKDEGVAIEYALQSLKENGVCLEELCPYDEKTYNVKPSNEAYIEATKRRIEGAQRVENKINDIKSALTEGFPIIGSFRVFKSLEKNTDGLVHMPTEDELEEESKYHAMVICGYNDTNKYFIVRNSWGKRFGHNGYCYIPYSYVRDSSLTRGLFIVKMNERTDSINITKDVDKPEDFSPRFSYEVNRNRINEEIFLLNEERSALQNAIISLRNVLAQIIANTDVNDFLQDIDAQITSKTDQVNNTEKKLLHTKEFNNIVKYAVYGISAIVIVWSLYNIWSDYTNDKEAQIILPIIFALLSSIAPIVCNYITNRIYKKNNYKLETLKDELNELQSLRERKIRAYSQLQRLLLIISSVESKVKKFDDDLSNIYDSFKTWLNNIKIIQNGNFLNDTDINSEILQEAKELANSIFDGDSSSSVSDKFMSYQLSLLRKIESNFAQSVYDELRNNNLRNYFIEQVVNIKAPVELNNRFTFENMVFLGDVSILSPNNQELPSVAETDCPNTIVNYNNPLVILGLVEKGFSIEDITDLSL